MKMADKKARRLVVLSWVLYGLSIMSLFVSLLLGFSIYSTAAAIPSTTIAFQSPLLTPLWDGLVSALHFVGGLILAGGAVIAIMMFCVGLLLGNTAKLSQRIAALEDALTERTPGSDLVATHRAGVACTVETLPA